MNKAFTSEGDGWNYCNYWGETCAYCDENGKCILPECLLEKEWLEDDD